VKVRLESRGDAFTTLGAFHRRAADLREGGAVGVGPLRRARTVVPEAHPPLGRAGAAKRPTCARPACRRARSSTSLTWPQHFESGAVHVPQWQEMDDEAIIEELVAIRGIGRWTAEMFLIFHLMRPNVLPLDDLGLIKGISVNYFSGEPVSRAEAREVGEAWAPFRSVATWYMWRSLDPLPVD
jgi:DNA-3-methyladenine glycosylase II